MHKLLTLCAALATASDAEAKSAYLHNIHGSYSIQMGDAYITCVDFRMTDETNGIIPIGAALEWPEFMTQSDADLFCLNAETKQNN